MGDRYPSREQGRPWLYAFRSPTRSLPNPRHAWRVTVFALKHLRPVFVVSEGRLIDGLSSIENPCLRSGLSRMVVPSICLRFVRLPCPSPGAWEAVEKGAPSAPPFLRNT